MSLISNKRGFALIELIVAVSIMLTLSGVVIFSFRSSNKSARDAKRRADLQEIRGTIENVRLETGSYPESENELSGYEVSYSHGEGENIDFLENIDSSFISRSYLDPMNNETYHYKYRVWNQPGCNYELTVAMEGENGQTCPACTLSPTANDATYYCVAN